MKNTTCRTSLNAAAAAFVVLVSATFAFSQTDVRNDGHGSKGPKGAACVIAEAGKPKITLVLGDQPSRPSRFAAEELKRIVREISGATCPIVTGKTDISGAMVAVGPPGENAVTAMLLQEAGVEFDSLELGPDGFLIHSVGPHVVLAGPTGRATLYAAYGLLERLGCRWCFPGEFGEVIPNKPSLKLNSLRVVEKPAFSYRTFMHHNHVTEETAEWIDWMAKNRMNRFLVTLYAAKGFKGQRYAAFKKTPGLLDAIARRGLSIEAGHHASYYWTPPAELYEKHPEWYALVNGKRGPVAIKGPRAQLCFSNQELADYTTERILAFARANPEADIISLYTNDGYGYCECEACQALGTKTDAYIVYVNRIARRVYEEMPDKKLAFLSYSHVSDPPAKVRVFGNNTMCVVATWPPPNVKRLKGWLASGVGQVALYEYYMGSYSNHSVPSLWTQAIADELKTIHKLGLVGVASQGELGNWGAYSLNYWVFARMIWDPTLDVNDVRQDYCRHYYAEAAKPMQAYFAFLETLGHIPRELKIAAEDVQKLERLLAAGEKAATTKAARARIRRDRIGLDYLTLAWQIEEHYRQAVARQAKGEYPAAIVQFEKAIVACKECLRHMEQYRDERVFLFGRPDAPTENVKYAYNTRYYKDRLSKSQRELAKCRRTVQKSRALEKEVVVEPGEAAAGTMPGILEMPSGVFVECEDFKLGGRWKLGSDKKHAGFSGKGYITETASAGIARFRPAKKVTVRMPGQHNVWLRAYLGGPPEEGMFDRELTVQVNDASGRPTHRGLDGDRYVWEFAGTMQVGPDRIARIQLEDLGRSPAVADCVLLTDDLEFKPADWAENSRRPGLTVPFRPTKTAPVDAEPYVLPRAARGHVVDVDRSAHEYQVRVAGTLDEFNTADYLDTYHQRLESRFQPNEFLTIENVGTTDVVNPRIVVDGRRDWFSAETILSSISRPGMTAAEKAMAIWKFASSIEVQCHDNNRRVGPYYPEEESQPSRNTYQERANPVKAANLYYCSGCQLSATNCVVLLRRAGLAARAVWMCPLDQYENHCVAEAWYDGAWHLFDPEQRSFHLADDNTTVASYEVLHNNPSLAARTHDGGFGAKYMGMRSYAKYYERFYPPSMMPVDPDWVSTMSMTLRPGEKLIWRWDHVGKFRLGLNPRNRNYEPYRLANGKIIYRPDLKNPGFRTGILSERNIKTTVQDGRRPLIHSDLAGATSFVSYKIKTPYPIVGGVVGGRFHRKTAADIFRISLSVNDSDWTEVWSADETGDIERYLAVDEVLGTKLGWASYECYVKYEFSAASDPTAVGINGVYLEFDLQMSGAGLPSLSAGTNKVVYRDDTGGPHRVRITHGWKESSATKPPLAPAAPVSPKDGAKLPTLDKLTWSAAHDPDGKGIRDYHIQVSPREDMLHTISPNFDRLTESNQPQWDVPQGWFVRGRTYHWRVRARDEWGAWSPWSNVWKFRVDAD